MDKIAANNHFVSMRKEVKKSKAMVSGNLIRKINKLKKEREKSEDEEQKRKIDVKIAKTLEETKLLKAIDSYKVAKHATLRPDPKIWEKMISDTLASTEQILEARIIMKNNIQRCVTKFRSDHKDCDEWFSEYIEFREKKRELTEVTKPFKRKGERVENEKKRHPKPKGKKENFSERLEVTNKTISKPDLKERSARVEDRNKAELLHPSWEIKRKEKEHLKAALSGALEQPKRIVF